MKIEISLEAVPYAELDAVEPFQKLPVRAPEHAGRMRLSFSVPILDMQGCWIPEYRTPSTKIPWVIESRSAGQRDFPFLSFFNSRNINVFSCGITNLTDDCRITAKMNQECCTYDIVCEVALPDAAEEFALVIDRRPVPWTEALTAWRNALELPAPEFPEAAWDPVFCTWYAVHAAVSQAWVEANAAAAAELGFRTLIVDDGWCFDAMKRVSPATIDDWYEWIGDWRLSVKKFPDFSAHRKRIKSLGMNYMLWVAPFLVGAKSRFLSEHPGAVRPECHEGCHTLDSSNEKAAEEMLDRLANLMRDLELDGLKVDFVDHIFPNPDRPQGRSATAFVRRLAEAVRAVKPDALIEFRQNYATPGMLAYGTQFRAGDVPFDFLDNIQRIAQIRIGVGDGVPVHADPVYWHPRESAVNISRHLIASLAGVPMISMDLTALSPTERRIINLWLGFYNSHRETFRRGHWQTGYYLSGLSWLAVQGGTEAIVISNDGARLSEALLKTSGPVWVLNLTGEELQLSGAETFDGEGNRSAVGVIPPGGCGHQKNERIFDLPLDNSPDLLYNIPYNNKTDNKKIVE